jgi:hypothetical protein
MIERITLQQLPEADGIADRPVVSISLRTGRRVSLSWKGTPSGIE